MKIECPQCCKIYSIPNDRLPQGKLINLPCSACKGTITLDLRSKDNESQDIEKDSSLTEEIVGEELKHRILSSVKDLPPMPQTVNKARKILSDPQSNFDQIAKVIETDQAIVTRVLKMANSAYYGLTGRVSTIQHASSVLGYRTLSEIITMAGSSNLLERALDGYQLEAGALWEHSLCVAFGSKIIAKKINPALENDAFTSGLIHDTGKIVLDPYLSERGKHLKSISSYEQIDFLSLERRLLGFDHAEIAFELCRSWNIPEDLTVAIRYHHNPSLCKGNMLANIVHLADALAMMSGLGTGIDGMQYALEESALEILSVSEEDLPVIIAEMAESVKDIESG
ncbi:MAG: zinc-ribbon domain-containing protein [Deltaproteobacteria bacterium]|nr:zinc-ribbon domain-containing protein [Deltaproteobacteria bacterium]